MAEAKPQPSAAQGAGEQDPSMEDILQSIRRIIAEDDKKGAPPADAGGNGQSNLGSDVLELTDMAPDDGSLMPLSADAGGRQADASATLDVLATIDNALSEEILSLEIPAAPAAAEPRPAAPATMANDQILSNEAAAVSSAAMKKLMQAKPEIPLPVTPSMSFRAGYTIEDLVMETLKPLLREWLNGNLPAIVERIVEREVKKLRDS